MKIVWDKAHHFNGHHPCEPE